MLCHLAQIVVSEVLDEINHQWIVSSPVAEVHELVVEVTSGLSRDAREVAFRSCAPFFAMTAGTREYPRRHRVAHRRPSGRSIDARQETHEEDEILKCGHDPRVLLASYAQAHFADAAVLHLTHDEICFPKCRAVADDGATMEALPKIVRERL